MTDSQLLQDYVETRSATAFAELVRRHADWVYAAAERQVHDPHMAEDLTQAVFIALAQNAPMLRAHVALPAWLFRLTRCAAINAMRTEARRRHHEQKAAAMSSEVSSVTDDRWDHLVPMLDEVVAQLGHQDQLAILLRFYQQKTFPQVGEALNVSEEAARKRVGRALEKLRTVFARRGVVMPSGALAGALLANVAPPASAALAMRSTQAALAGVQEGVVAGHLQAIGEGGLRMMRRAQVKFFTAMVAGCLLAVVPIVAWIAQGLATDPKPAAVSAAFAKTGPASAPSPVSPASPLDANGTVTDPFGKPIADAEVDVIRQRYQPGTAIFQGVDVIAKTRSDQQGRFQLHCSVPDTSDVGGYFVRATGDGLGYTAAMLSTSDGVRFLDFVRQQRFAEPSLILFPATPLRGTVVDEQSKPVAGAVVALDSIADAVVTDAAGAFSIEKASPAEFGIFTPSASLTIRHAEFVTYAQQLRDSSADSAPSTRPSPMRFILRHGVLVQGRLLDRSTGGGLAGCGVVAESRSRGASALLTAYSDVHGRYSLRVLPGDFNLHPMGSTNYYPLVADYRLSVKANGPQVALDFQFQPGHVIAGAVGGKSPELQHLLVHASSAGQRGAQPFWAANPYLPIGPDGKFRIEALRPGSYEVEVWRAGISHPLASTSVQVPAEGNPPAVVLNVDAASVPSATDHSATAQLRGTILLPDGHPAANGCIRLIGGNRGYHGAYALPDGTFTIDNVAISGPAMVWAWDVLRTNAAAIELPAGFDLAKPLEVKLQPATILSGRVHDADGEAFPDVQVALSERSSDGMNSAILLSTTVDDDGRYALRGYVPPPPNRRLQVMLLHARLSAPQTYILHLGQPWTYELQDVPEDRYQHLDFRLTPEDRPGGSGRMPGYTVTAEP